MRLLLENLAIKAFPTRFQKDLARIFPLERKFYFRFTFLQLNKVDKTPILKSLKRVK